MSNPPAPAFDIRRHTLDNGLRVVLQPDPRLPLVAVNLWYHVGSKNERPGRTGFAHLLEHLMFEGSAHVGPQAHFHYVQQAGGVANGSTWYDRTNYHETLPSHQLDLALWLESDRMGFFLPAIDQKTLDNQRDVVINERRQRVDNQPYGHALERLYELAFAPGHPYRWPVIGHVEDLEAATLDDVRDFFGTYYVPDNAVLTLAGDLPEDAIARVERFFGDFPAGGSVPRPEVPDVRLDGERRAVLEDAIRLPRVYMAFPSPAFGTEAWYTADLWATAVSDGKTSVWHRDLVYERELAQDVGAYVYETEAASCLLVVATAQAGVEIDRLEAALGEHLERAGREPLAEADVARARNMTLTAHFDRLQNLERRADLLSELTTFFDDPGAALKEPERYRRPDAAAMMAFAAERLRPELRAVVTVVPADEPAGGSSAGADA